MKIVVKVGTSTLAYPTGHINIRRVECLCKVLADIANAGNEVILVTSGAVGMGMGFVVYVGMCVGISIMRVFHDCNSSLSEI